MEDSMKKVTKLDVELTVKERNLLFVGYKNVIGVRRASWRIMSLIEQKEGAKENEVNVKRIKDYHLKVEDEVSKICNYILIIIDEHLIPSSNIGESTIFLSQNEGRLRYLVVAWMDAHHLFTAVSVLQGQWIYSSKPSLLQNRVCYEEKSSRNLGMQRLWEGQGRRCRGIFCYVVF